MSIFVLSLQCFSTSKRDYDIDIYNYTKWLFKTSHKVFIHHIATFGILNMPLQFVSWHFVHVCKIVI